MKPSRLAAWSNLAYPLAGVASGDLTAAILLSILGLGSYAYHSGRWWWGGKADVGGMYAAFAGLSAAIILPWWLAVPIGLALLGWSWIDPWWQDKIHFKVGVGWVTLAGLTAVQHPDPTYFAAGVCAFAVAYASWLTDPEYNHWGHTFWHIATSIGFYALRASLI